MENAVFVVITLGGFDVLRILSGPDYLRVFEPDCKDGKKHLERLSNGPEPAVDPLPD